MARRASSERHAREDYHDPTAGVGGSAPARSALTLRLMLAIFGLVICGGGTAAFAVAGAPLAVVVIGAVLAAIALVDIVVVARRKWRGEPG